MLARYRIVRGARDLDDPLPEGIRQDTRKHTRHVLRPSAELVLLLLDDSSQAGSPARERAFAHFKRGYLTLIEQRFTSERQRFDELATLACHENVYLGCNCPTERQPEVRHCHTVLALDFMHRHYPTLIVRAP